MSESAEKKTEKRVSAAGMTVRVGMPLAFTLVVSMAVLISLVAWLRYTELAEALESIAEDAVPVVMTTRNLSMASKGLANYIAELTLAKDLDALQRQATFSRLATEKLAKALREAELILPDRQKLAMLQQIHGQISDNRERLAASVRESLTLSQ